ETIKKRSEFLRIRGGARGATPLCVVETKPAPEGVPSTGPRFGFTGTKQLGNAVVRNRIRRRLKAAVNLLQQANARTGFDYVLVARSAAYDCPFPELVKELEYAFHRVHHPAGAKSRGRSRRPG